MGAGLDPLSCSVNQYDEWSVPIAGTLIPDPGSGRQLIQCCGGHPHVCLLVSDYVGSLACRRCQIFLLSGLRGTPLPLANCERSGYSAFLLTCHVSAFYSFERPKDRDGHGEVALGFTEAECEESKESRRERESAFQAAGTADAKSEIHKTVSLEPHVVKSTAVVVRERAMEALPGGLGKGVSERRLLL